jgi:hypothetical protein
MRGHEASSKGRASLDLFCVGRWPACCCSLLPLLNCSGPPVPASPAAYCTPLLPPSIFKGKGREAAVLHAFRVEVVFLRLGIMSSRLLTRDRFGSRKRHGGSKLRSGGGQALSRCLCPLCPELVLFIGQGMRQCTRGHPWPGRAVVVRACLYSARTRQPGCKHKICPSRLVSFPTPSTGTKDGDLHKFVT